MSPIDIAASLVVPRIMRTQFPVTDTSTASTTQANLSGLFGCFDYIEQIIALVPELRESLRVPRSAGSDTKIIIQRLKSLFCKDYVSKVYRICQLSPHRGVQ